MRMLIVDDNTEILTMLARILVESGDNHETKTAASAEEVLSSFIESHETENPYTFICLKQPLFSMDGLEVIRRIRLYEQTSSNVTSRCMVCVLSPQRDCRQSFYQALGYDPYLSFVSQPLNLFDLLDVVREHHIGLEWRF